MEHLFYAPDIVLNPELPEEESQHCARVLRLKNGDAITVTDGKGFLYKAILTETHPKHCRIGITEKQESQPLWNVDIHIAISPTKNTDRMEWLVEKTTEIGINRITFLRCRYSERREIKLQRLIKIAVSAMKQSQKTTLPEINGIVDFRKFIAHRTDACKMIGYCSDGEKNLIKDIYKPRKNVAILIGPEGDFSPEEINAAISAGFSPVSLGGSRLRTETAALAACHTIHVLNM
ncbi:MAG: 16S rRNA (uracil(1498)-N(3))-methyltransferase [Tannerella sp.]|jgi:16S rRNA (uracil1498-N3)-methyltransferase|nr:16S rRNA (uracil(1498)-N(3))-methyltransferase [Tannerella sp.]